MATVFVSRHPGAIDWVQQQGIHVDRFVPHLSLELVHPGDCVIGTLPLHLVAQLQQRGVRYLHLMLTMPAAWRGQELSAEQLDVCQATVQEFVVYTVD